jgi:(2Fe-2S) ferredoxin
MTPEELEQIAESEHEAQGQIAHRVNVCVAAGCLSCQSQSVKDAIDANIKERGWEKQCRTKGVGCMGLCAEGPLVQTDRGTMYQHVTAADAPEILDSIEGAPVSRLVLGLRIPHSKACSESLLSSTTSKPMPTSHPSFATAAIGTRRSGRRRAVAPKSSRSREECRTRAW